MAHNDLRFLVAAPCPPFRTRRLVGSVLQAREVAAGRGPGRGPVPRPGAARPPAAALASPVTGRCPAQPRRCDTVVVRTTTVSHRRGNPGSRGGLAGES